MELSAADLAWSVVQKALSAQLPSGADRCWSPQPEFSPLSLDVFRSVGNIEILQTFRPDALAFRSAGLEVSQDFPSGVFDLVLFVPTRQRTESLALLAEGLLRLAPKGRLLFACANTQGAGGFLSRIRELFPELEAESAKKCRWAFLSTPNAEGRERLRSWIADGGPMPVPHSPFRSLPGIYGWNKIDRGSELLASTLPSLGGKGADLGSGYGYLSHCLLEQSPAIERIHVVEADTRALNCARENLQAWASRCLFHWLDAAAPELRSSIRGLDWVVMNPPFHEGSQVDPQLGKAFIESAGALLRPDGQLFMVANSFLGYEEALMQNFKKVSRVLDQEGFKVIHAVR